MAWIRKRIIKFVIKFQKSIRNRIIVKSDLGRIVGNYTNNGTSCLLYENKIFRRKVRSLKDKEILFKEQFKKSRSRARAYLSFSLSCVQFTVAADVFNESSIPGSPLYTGPWTSTDGCCLTTLAAQLLYHLPRHRLGFSISLNRLRSLVRTKKLCARIVYAEQNSTK